MIEMGNDPASAVDPATTHGKPVGAFRTGDAIGLQAGGYSGSTYELSYDPASDRLKGVFFQAVAKQRYDIYFERQKS